jgi:hypothetical protein
MINRQLAVFMLALISSVTLVTPAHTGTSCHKINAKGEGQDLGGGMTEARIFGGGLLNGTTEAQFEIVGGAAPAFDFDGAITFTTNKATLTVDIAGIFNVATGEFFAAGPVAYATGKLEGAVGMLVFDGIQNLGDGSFVEIVTGQICVDLAP